VTNLRHWQKDSEVIKCTDKRCVVSFRDVRATMSLCVTRVNVHHISLPVSGQARLSCSVAATRLSCLFYVTVCEHEQSLSCCVVLLMSTVVVGDVQ